MRLFFNIILVICIVILVTHQSFYLYKYNKILSICIYFSGIVKKILLKKNKFEYIE